MANSKDTAPNASRRPGMLPYLFHVPRLNERKLDRLFMGSWGRCETDAVGPRSEDAGRFGIFFGFSFNLLFRSDLRVPALIQYMEPQSGDESCRRNADQCDG